MKRRISLTTAIVVLGISADLNVPKPARAVGVFFADPGWAYTFDGDEAFYYDPDGPNPDYINGNDQNQPGGNGHQPALVDPGPACEPNCGAVAEWIGIGQWEGSKPGAPLGGVPTGSLVPPLPPPAPGGVGTYTEAGGTTFLRIQDAGNPQSYGWADKGAQLAFGTPRQEGNNRRMLFGHNIARDAGFGGSTAVIDNGITISFRTRLATRATGPLDDVFPESGSTLANTIPWPEEGLGYEVHTGARGMFMISQTRAGGAKNQMGFSLLNDNTVTLEELESNVGTKRGLVMNNRAANSAGGGPVETNEATPATANVFEIPSNMLDEWHEFWITVKSLPMPVDGNTHEVNVYHNGSLTPQTFHIILSLENEFGGSAYLGMGLSSDTRIGAFDVDFLAYKEGVIVPMLAPMGLAGDYNDDGSVDAADYVAWRNGGPLANETVTIGSITAEDYVEWRANFGAVSGAADPARNSSSHPVDVPEPAGTALVVPLILAIIAGAVRRP